MYAGNFAESRGRTLVSKLKDVIPRQQFENCQFKKQQLAIKLSPVLILKPYVKTLRLGCMVVTLPVGKKLLKKQKEGKKHYEAIGSVSTASLSHFTMRTRIKFKWYIYDISKLWTLMINNH